MENRILPDNTNTLSNKSSQNVSVVNNLYMPMDLDTNEGVETNPTDPHDRAMKIDYKKECETSYNEEEGLKIQEDQVISLNDSLFEKLGPEFFGDDNLISSYYDDKIKSAKPYSVIHIDAEQIYLD
jgi:hypothetical protein